MKAVELSTVHILRMVGWAKSNGEARRMIQSGGLRIDGERHDLDEFYFTGSSFIMQYGRRLFARIHIPCMKEYYDDSNDIS